MVLGGKAIVAVSKGLRGAIIMAIGARPIVRKW